MTDSRKRHRFNANVNGFACRFRARDIGWLDHHYLYCGDDLRWDVFCVFCHAPVTLLNIDMDGWLTLYILTCFYFKENILPISIFPRQWDGVCIWKPSLLKTKIQHYQYHGCSWAGHSKRWIINSHGIDLIFPKHSSLITWVTFTNMD